MGLQNYHPVSMSIKEATITKIGTIPEGNIWMMQMTKAAIQSEQLPNELGYWPHQPHLRRSYFTIAATYSPLTNPMIDP